MAEAGGPAVEEMQAQKPAMRLQDRLGKWARETFTPQGRAEVMAQKRIDEVLRQLPEEDRAKAMELAEKQRPELIESFMDKAKGSLVRDAVIGAVVVGGVAGVGYWQRDRFAGALYDAAGGVDKMGRGVRKAVGGVGSRVQGLRSALGERITNIRTNFQGAVADARARRGGKTPDVGKLMDALSGAIKLDALDALDTAHPVSRLFEGGKTTMLASSELQNMQAEHLVDQLVDLAKQNGRWVALVTAKGREPWGFGDEHEGIGGLMKRGLVTMRELADGKKLFVPTEAFVEFVKKHLVT